MIALALVAAVGATLVVVHSTIAMWFRRLWPKLLCCPQCSGFWVGCAFGAATAYQQSAEPLGFAMLVACFGFATSVLATATSLLMYAATGRRGPAPPDPCAPKENGNGHRE